MKKLFLLLFFSAVLISQVSAQIRTIVTNKEAISQQIPGFEEVRDISTKQINYTPSQKLLNRFVNVDTVEKTKELNFAESLSVKIEMKDGSITRTSDGQVWSVRIAIPNASNMRLIFDTFQLSSTAEMYIFDEPVTQLDSAITIDKFSYTEFVSSSVFNSEALIVYIVDSRDDEFSSKVSISTIYAGPSTFGDNDNTSDNIGIMSSSCIPVITCYQSRMPYARAVARIVVGGSGGTGTLLNNESSNGRAYFLTAFHVVDANDNGFLEPSEIAALSSAMFEFQYWRNSCTGTINNGLLFTGAQLRSQSSNTDMVLLELLNGPGVGDGVNYAGWNRSSSSASSAFVAHHPEGNDMRYSASSSISTSILHSSYWRVTYTTGVTEPGSSGAALFNQNNQVVGQLWGGASSCTFTDFGDRYGKFSESWNQPTLKTYLSPVSNLTATSLLNLHDMQIEGLGTVPCDGTPVVYRVPNLDGCTYNWDVSYNMDVVSGQGTNVVSVKKNSQPSSFPEGLVSVTITDSKGYNQTVDLTKNVTVGFPNGYILQPIVSGPSCASGGSLLVSIGASYNGNTSCDLRHNSAINEIEWQIVSDFPHTLTYNDGIFTCYSTSLVDKAGLRASFVDQYNPYVVQIRLRAKDICGTWSDWTPGFYHLVSRCNFIYSYHTDHNPHTETLNIHSNNEKKENLLATSGQIRLTLMDVNGEILIDEEKTSFDNMAISTKDLSSGKYFLTVSTDEISEISEIEL